MIDIAVKIADDEGNRAWCKIVWSTGISEFPPYLVDRDALAEAATEVRLRLADVVAEAMKSGTAACGRELHAAAQAGYFLRSTLFDRRAGEQDPKEIEDWLAEVGPDVRIVFTVQPRIHIPWGLIFDREPVEHANGDYTIDKARFEDFWAYKYQTSTVYAGLPPAADNRRIPGGSLRIIAVINKSVFDEAAQLLSREEHAWVESILKIAEPLASNQSELFQRWKDSVGDNCLIYFYCHADGNNLALATDRLTPNKLRVGLRRNAVDGNPTSLVFLNGCSTASGDPKGGFLEAMGPPSLSGFIGTEAPVPDMFALRFGTELLHKFIQSGKTIRDTVQELRAAHWPLGLLYSVCCYPEIVVAPPMTLEGVPNIDTENFSTQQIGSADDSTMA